MVWYVARRLCWAFLASLLILTVTFGLLAASPDPQASQAALDAAQSGEDPEAAQQLLDERRGTDRSLTSQYVDYVVGMYTLDWGQSFLYEEDVTSVIGDAWVYSAMIVVPATIVAVLVGFTIGIYSATHQYSRLDYVATAIAFFGISVPNFWLAIMLILFFVVVVPVPELVAYDTSNPLLSWANVANLILPIFVLTTAAVASQMRYARAEALEYVEAEFVKAARAKGVDEPTLTYRHVFRPSLVPLVTILIGDLVGIIFATAYVVEYIFGIPGLGLLSYNAIVNGDTPLVLATTLIPVFVAILGNLAQDVAYTVLDPRIDYEGRR